MPYVNIRITREGATPEPWSFEALGASGPVHVTAVPLSDEQGPLGFAVVLEDMSWVFRREVQTIFASQALAAIPLEHEIFRTIYKITSLKTKGIEAKLEGLKLGGETRMLSDSATSGFNAKMARS